MAGVPNIPDLTQLELNFDAETFLEKRMENDANGNPVYVGWAKAGTATDALAWFIVKITYDANNSPTRQEIANNSPTFEYSWTARISYF